MHCNNCTVTIAMHNVFHIYTTSEIFILILQNRCLSNLGPNLFSLWYIFRIWEKLTARGLQCLAKGWTEEKKSQPADHPKIAKMMMVVKTNMMTMFSGPQWYLHCLLAKAERSFQVSIPSPGSTQLLIFSSFRFATDMKKVSQWLIMWQGRMSP